jgi:hypothetical protein
VAAVAFVIEPPRRKWVISMDLERIDSTSLETLWCSVFADAGGQPYNPTADAVAMAFMTAPNTKPASGDWKTGGWDTSAIGTYTATCLVGPGGAATLVPGSYFVWVRITDNPEIVIREVGELTVD